MKCRGTYIMGLSISWGCPYTNVVTKNFPFQEYITIASIYIKRNAFFLIKKSWEPKASKYNQKWKYKLENSIRETN